MKLTRATRRKCRSVVEAHGGIGCSALLGGMTLA
jgi:hypothetical protein